MEWRSQRGKRGDGYPSKGGMRWREKEREWESDVQGKGIKSRDVGSGERAANKMEGKLPLRFEKITLLAPRVSKVPPGSGESVNYR
jgi:hypothetical protein